MSTRKITKSQAYRLKRFFRLSVEDAQKVRDYQDWHPVYSVLLAKDGQRESFDHRWADGLLRGWLAAMLNKAYGMIERLYKDNTGTVLRALADYHDNPPAKELLGPRYGIINKAIKKKNPKYGPPSL